MKDLGSFEPVGQLARELRMIELLEDILKELRKNAGNASTKSY